MPIATPTIMRDLWPDDIKSEDIISPEEILNHQASRLEARTNGLLTGQVVKLAGKDRLVLGFEIEAPRAGRRVRLFEVQHRLEFGYPAKVIPPESLPDFLKDQVYRPPSLGLPQLAFEGRWEKNEWVASSPTEFTNKVEEVLASAAVKAIVLSLLSSAKANGSQNSNEGTNAEGPSQTDV